MTQTIRFPRGIAVLLVLLLLFLASSPVLAEEEYAASTMRLLRYEGDVTIENPDGSSRFVLENVDHAREARDAALRAIAPYTRNNASELLEGDTGELS